LSRPRASSRWPTRPADRQPAATSRDNPGVLTPVRRLSAAAAAVAVALALAFVAGCGGGGGDSAAPAAPTSIASPTTARPDHPPYDVIRLQRTYVDKTRPTTDPNGAHNSPVRTLVTTIRVPDGRGSFPLVVFAHGNSGHPRKVTQLLDAWARAGYVVAAPAFPLTNADVKPTIIGDYVQEPADITTVIDGVLADSKAASSPLRHEVDADHIGVAGHSLGGAAVYGLAANTCCVDARVDAVAVLSGARLDFPGGAWEPASTPLLAMHGSLDLTIRIAAGRSAYDAWNGPKTFVTLMGALHSPQYEDVPSPYDALVIDVTTLFWNAELRGGARAEQSFAGYVPPANLATIDRRP